MRYNMANSAKTLWNEMVYMVSPIYAANNFILKAMDQGIKLTPLKLQKLLYILYARYLYKTGEALFADRFSAWEYGPVLPEIYYIFKRDGSSPITVPKPDYNGEILVVTEEGEFGECFNDVWRNFANKSASELVSKTHEPGAAWAQAVVNEDYHLGGFLEDSKIKRDGEAWFE